MSRDPIDLNHPAAFREELFRGVREAIAADASARTSKGRPSVETSSLHEIMIANAKAGRPLFAGASIWRGSKDPDVESGTFDPSWKHGSPSVEIAAGYAQDANSKIGFNPASTAGFGVIARYDLDASMRFYGNFGIEDGRAGKNLQQIESEIKPLINAYLQRSATGILPTDAITPEEQAIHQYLHSNMYEASIPSSIAASQKWLSYPTGEATYEAVEIAGASAPQLQAVLASIVDARRLELDAYGTRRAIQEIKQVRNSSTEHSPGLAEDLSEVIHSLEKTLARTLRSTHGPAETLEGTIETRRAHQAGMSLTRLTNASGHNIGTGRPEDDVLNGIARICQQAQAGQVHARAAGELSNIHSALSALHSTASNMATQATKLMENSSALQSNANRRETNALRSDALADKQAALKSKIASARLGLLNKVYYASFGKKQMNAWLASAKQTDKSLRNNATDGRLLEAEAKSLSDERVAIEGARAQLARDHAKNFERVKEERGLDELQDLSLGSPKKKIAAIVDLVKGKLDEATVHLDSSSTSARMLHSIAQLARAGLPLATAYQSVAGPLNESNAGLQDSVHANRRPAAGELKMS